MPKIDAMYAFVCEDSGPNDEGVMSFCEQHPLTGKKTWYPMVGADTQRVHALKPIADEIAAKTGRPYKILRFTRREEIQVVNAADTRIIKP